MVPLKRSHVFLPLGTAVPIGSSAARTPLEVSLWNFLLTKENWPGSATSKVQFLLKFESY